MSKPDPEPPFTPVPVRARHDGWTVEKQYAFIEALADTGIVDFAAACWGHGANESRAL